MNRDPLFDAIMDSIVFLELSDPDTLDPSAAALQLENVYSHFSVLSKNTRQSFAAAAREEAAQEEKEHGLSHRAQVLYGLADDLEDDM